MRCPERTLTLFRLFVFCCVCAGKTTMANLVSKIMMKMKLVSSDKVRVYDRLAVARMPLDSDAAAARARAVADCVFPFPCALCMSRLCS